MANRKVVLTGNGVNCHVLEGKFVMGDGQVNVIESCELKHEKPDGTFAEHHTLEIDKGTWVMGKQVEYNPFRRSVTQIWD